ncbi:spermidine/putrescine-binding periplasmic protein [Beggiatoa alba B18LD]|uniref:Spermidine/putrescine-binding periplasmic protein n=1 Tax=Beggiatoa alba B18LD TaxID=395493 RepID=I3CF56_9GAMM|nr:extracellular solute-binding protein [Beggiatoa alba]EIJ42249.1 spermidine/putrescine-binding periplasmic protein [Beggiatoa alba B18LD]
MSATSQSAFIKRRHFLKQTLAVSLSSAVNFPIRAYARAPLTVGVYEGAFRQVFEKAIYPEFTQATGIVINSIGIPSSDAWIGQLEVALRNRFIPADVSLVSQLGMTSGEMLKVWATLDVNKLSNITHIAPYLYQNLNAKQVYGIGAMSRALALVSDATLYPTAPNRWANLWAKDKNNKLGLMSLVNNGFLLEITALTFFNGLDILNTDEGVQKVFNQLRELKEQVTLWYRDAIQFPVALKEKEITLGQCYQDTALLAKEAGIKLNSEFPQEGTIVDTEYWAITAGSPQQTEAEIFIDYLCQPAIQAKLTQHLHIIPLVEQRLLGIPVDSSVIPPRFGMPNYKLQTEKRDWLAQQWSELIS